MDPPRLLGYVFLGFNVTIDAFCNGSIGAFNAPVHALPYISVGFRKSASLLMLKFLLLESLLHFYNTP